MDLVNNQTLLAAVRAVDLVEPAREEKQSPPKSRRDAEQRLNSLVVRCRWLAAFGVVPKDGWASAQRAADELLDFIFEGHEQLRPVANSR